MKTALAVLHSIVPVFIACVGALYLFQAPTSRRIFTRRECWIIGITAELVAVLFSLNNRFQWFS